MLTERDFTPRELQAIREIATKLDISEHKVLVQALRTYQLIIVGTHRLVKVGEPCLRFRIYIAKELTKKSLPASLWTREYRKLAEAVLGIADALAQEDYEAKKRLDKASEV